MKEILEGKIHGYFLSTIFCFATKCLLVTCQTALVGDSGIIGTQTGE
jgi:hypothetical protein